LNTPDFPLSQDMMPGLPLFKDIAKIRQNRPSLAQLIFSKKLFKRRIG
jgi:hypothetical protein